jgi:hypothetical protein
MLSPRCIPFLFVAASLTAAETTDLATLAAEAQAAHSVRNLGVASALYQRMLAQERPVAPTAEQQAQVLRYAPRLHLVTDEFFPLKDIVAIVHPERPVIAYHLFWEDDFGFPSDNDPCDHEVVWVEFDRASGKVTDVWTYFHGKIVTTPTAVAEANAHEGRPWIGVEWGFHGSMPWQAPGHVAVVDETLRAHWDNAHRKMKLVPPDPLARGWPTDYRGDFAAYTNYNVPLDPRPALRQPGLCYVSRWANATLNRYCLRYNFAAKLEWPWLAAASANHDR